MPLFCLDRTGMTSEKPIGAGRRFMLMGAALEAAPLAPALYLVATPIGNLSDITIRALQTLAGADLIACEDTRVSHILLDHYGIRTPLLTYHEHNAAKQRPKLLAALAQGKSVALISDAGTPLISDPGYRLVDDVVAAGFDIVPVPGASALLTAIVASGLATDTFVFAGFLPTKSGARRRRVEALAGIAASLVFYESPRRLPAALKDLCDVLGDERPSVVGRELTKKFETFKRGSLKTLSEYYEDQKIKGEIAIVVGPPAPGNDAVCGRYRRRPAGSPDARRGQRGGRRSRQGNRPKPQKALQTRRRTAVRCGRRTAVTAATKRRKAAFRLGVWAERLAAVWLTLKGYRILARRFRTARGEIDLIVKRADTIAFVEVKARRQLDQAIESVGPQTRRRISDAARIWISQNTYNPNNVYRFDVVAISLRHLPHHIENAFDEV